MIVVIIMKDQTQPFIIANDYFNNFLMNKNTVSKSKIYIRELILIEIMPR